MSFDYEHNRLEYCVHQHASAIARARALRLEADYHEWEGNAERARQYREFAAAELNRAETYGSMCADLRERIERRTAARVPA